jgi:hypothetical protein
MTSLDPVGLLTEALELVLQVLPRVQPDRLDESALTTAQTVVHELTALLRLGGRRA